nr:ulp1 protease family, C-terminal catalytic domain-containing protein [Tanacetum cinerariifolium]
MLVFPSLFDVRLATVVNMLVFPSLFDVRLATVVPWTNEHPLENRELNAVIGTWFTLWRDYATPVFVDQEISTQADGAQSSRVPVPLPEYPYEAIRQAYLDGTDTKSEPFKDHVETKTPESPLTIAPPTSLPESTSSTLVPILRRTARMVVRVPPAMSPGLSTKDDEEDEEIEESLDSDSVSEDVKDEGPTAEDGDPATRDEGLATRDEGPDLGVESCGSDDESRGLDDEGQCVESHCNISYFQ